MTRDDSIGKNWFVNLNPGLKQAWLAGKTLDPSEAEQTGEPVVETESHDFYWRLKRHGRQRRIG